MTRTLDATRFLQSSSWEIAHRVAASRVSRNAVKTISLHIEPLEPRILLNSESPGLPLLDPSIGYSEGQIVYIGSAGEGQLAQSGPRGDAARPTNPTAPNEQTRYLAGDFTDTDRDGMTDVAELKYGFDPLDPASFPSEPDVITPKPLDGTGIGAVCETAIGSITIRWTNPEEGGGYSLILYNGEQQLYYGGHAAENAVVNYARFGLGGTETLTGHFSEHAADMHWVQDFPEFTIDLSKWASPPVGDSANTISYTFEGFPQDNEQRYRAFLQRVWPIMYDRLGPPAETFNTVITNMGANSAFFMITNNGRTFLSDTSFIPRLVVHEFVHAWKGSYQFTSDSNWQYNDALSGFEEGSAEGMAFEIVHDYVRAYPDDSATIQLLNWRPYQYWSNQTTVNDSIEYIRATGAGAFWTGDNVYHAHRYSVAATTFQDMAKENPDVYKDIMKTYFARINNDPAWRSNRADVLDIWAQVVPQINGNDTEAYLDSMPVFQGHKLDEGIYVLSLITPSGAAGDQQFAVTYVPPSGVTYWGILKSEVADNNLPDWLKYDPGADAYMYIDTQDQPFTVDVYNVLSDKVASFEERTKYERRDDGTATGVGWTLVGGLAMQNFPVGLYRETVTFDNYIAHDPGAREELYFFGYGGLDQDRATEYVIMIGVDGVPGGNVTISLDGTDYTEPIVNGSAVFRSNVWPFDLEGQFPVTVTNSNGRSHTYYRTLLEAGTWDGSLQSQFIIVDKNFNGIEDTLEELPAAGVLQFNTYNYSAGEYQGTATITVTRRGGSEGVVSVDYATGDGSAIAGQDYVPTSGTITFGDGDAESKTFTVPISIDGNQELQESLVLALANPTGGAILGGTPVAELAIIDGDAPPTVASLVTNDATPALTGIVDNPTASLQVTVNGGVYAGVNNGDGTWTLPDNTISPGLEDGVYDVTVTATDSFSNVRSDSTTAELTVDRTWPELQTWELSDDTGNDAHDRLTNDTSPALTFTFSEVVFGDASDVTVTDPLGHAVVPDSVTGWSSDTLSVTFSTELTGDGVYTITLKGSAGITDDAGNSLNNGTDETMFFTLDTTTPAVALTLLATNDPTPALTGRIDDSGATIQVRVDGSVYAATNSGDGTWVLPDNTIAPALGDGLYDVEVAVTDSAGNVDGDWTTNELTIAARSLTVTVSPMTTNDTSPVLTGTVDDAAAAIQVTVNGKAYAGVNGGDGMWTLPADTIWPDLHNCVYDVAVVATDSTGTVDYPPIPLDDSGIGAYLEVTCTTTVTQIVIRWTNPQEGGGYSLTLYNGEQQLYYGGHPLESALVSYAAFGLDGTETLIGSFSQYAADYHWVQAFPEFTINLARIPGAEARYVGSDSTTDELIVAVHDDMAGITVSPISGNTTEAGGTGTFTVVLNSQPTADVTIGLTSSDTTEGTVFPSTVTFTSADWDTAQTVTATGVNDFVQDGDLIYSIVTGAATSTDENYGGRDAADMLVTNTDDDVAGITVSAISGNTTEAGGTGTFTVVLNSQPTADVTIGLTSSDTTEGTVFPSTVTFTSADWDTAQTVTATGVNDFVQDGNTIYTIVTAAAISTDHGYNGLDAVDVSLANTDLDTVEIQVTGNDQIIVDEDTTPDTGDDSDFGIAIVGIPVSRTYTVRNTGTAELTVGEVTAPTGYTVTEQPNRTIAAGQSDTFTVRLDATAAGTYPGEISFTSNDGDGGDGAESPFNFAIAGTVFGPGIHRDGTVVWVVGTGDADKIRIKKGKYPGSILVSNLNMMTKQKFSPQVYVAGEVTAVVVYGLDGNDTIVSAQDRKAVPVPLTVYGGDGNDKITGDRGNDILYGEDGDDLIKGMNGDDILVGGPGNDTLYGGNGNDMLYGGGRGESRKRQILHGGNGRDVLVSGKFQQEAGSEGLMKLLAEWTRPDFVYDACVINLRNGTGLNTPVILSDETVAGNGSQSRLIGGKGVDWYLSGPADWVSTLDLGEQINAMA